ncbi:hypothetical protein [Clostridium homopropionicum]|uniref:hypothetical protein n=1 Tax=Clostridium homopropionicum TaxID=36844 RepID=UPI0011134410|nr:hypothetical protein [Clostridium homopropionicum]
MGDKLHSYTCRIIANYYNLIQLYLFKCIRGFRKKNMLQIDVIEDIRDEIFTIENGWHNPELKLEKLNISLKL